MTRSELEHIIRAASAITNEYEIVVIGSQSILGQVPMAPETLLMSMEADVFALQQPDLSDLIDTINERVAKLPIDDDHKRLLEQRITALQAGKLTSLSK